MKEKSKSHLEHRVTVGKVKDTLYSINGKLNFKEKKTSELEDTLIKTIKI